MAPDHTAKIALVQIISRLDVTSLTGQKRKEIDAVISQLSKRNVIIPNSAKGRLQVSRFIELFFCAYPSLMTEKNKRLLEESLNNKAAQASVKSSHKK